MRRTSLLGGAAMWLLFLGHPLGAAEEAEKDKPIDLGLVEKARVRLTIVDVVVVDPDGRTVPGLEAADFEVVAGGKEYPVASLDVECPLGALDEPRRAYATGDPERTSAPPAARRIVLAFDYQHLNTMQRTDVLEQAKEMIREGGSPDDEVMVVALNGRLRVEQPFARDAHRTLRTLHRMEYDVTLLNGTFFHQSERGFVDSLTALFDILGTIPGPKGVVLFSAMRDAPLDLQFRRVASFAAAARAMVYPVDVRGLDSVNRGMAATRPGTSGLDGASGGVLGPTLPTPGSG